MRIVHLIAAAAIVSMLGCSSTSEPAAPTTTADTGTIAPDTATSGTDTGGGTDTGTNVGEVGATKPATPSMTAVVKMAGVLHASWKLNDTGITKVELWRNKDGGAFAKAYTYSAPAKDQHDGGAEPPGAYCYKVISFKGEMASETSTEMCGTP